jgi:hypothetical protein
MKWKSLNKILNTSQGYDTIECVQQAYINFKTADTMNTRRDLQEIPSA